MYATSKNCYDDDTQLMLQVAKGNKSAFIKIYHEYLPIVVSYLASLDVSSDSRMELAQEVFLRIWQHKAKFQAKSSVKTYLFGLVKMVYLEDQKQNLAASKFRKKYSREYPGCSNVVATPESDLNHSEIAHAVEKAVSRLNTRQKQAIELFYIKRLSAKEASMRAGCSIKALESRLHRARRRLCQVLTHELEEI